MTDAPFVMPEEQPLHFPPARDVIGAPVSFSQYWQDRLLEAWMNHKTSEASRAMLKRHAVIWRRS